MRVFILIFAIFQVNLTFAQEGTYSIPATSSSGVSVYLEEGEYTITFVSGAYKFASDGRPEPYHAATVLGLVGEQNSNWLYSIFNGPPKSNIEIIENLYAEETATIKIDESNQYRLYFSDNAYGDNSGSVTLTISSSCGCDKCLDEGETQSSLEKGKASFLLPTSTGYFKTKFGSTLPSNITSPEYFFYISSSADEETLSTPTGQLHQIKNDVGLTQIDVIDEDSYTVKQYSIDQVGAKDVDGFYTVTGDPDTEITFSKTQAEPNTLNIEEKKGGAVVKNTSFSYNSTESKWTMGQDTDGNGTIDRYEYEDETTSGSNTIKTAFILNGDQSVASKILR
ncbi:MAG: hypothetical protein NE328_01105 [Lentisphaeraceae bacterium]|nr:hypothetical protein [Lentisphaeraceae bacterium]